MSQAPSPTFWARPSTNTSHRTPPPAKRQKQSPSESSLATGPSDSQQTMLETPNAPPMPPSERPAPIQTTPMPPPATAPSLAEASATVPAARPAPVPVTPGSADSRKRRASPGTKLNTLPPPLPSPTPGSSAAVSIPSLLSEEPGRRRSRTNTPWSKEEEIRLKRMREEGLSWNEIAKVRSPLCGPPAEERSVADQATGVSCSNRGQREEALVQGIVPPRLANAVPCSSTTQDMRHADFEEEEVRTTVDVAECYKLT